MTSSKWNINARMLLIDDIESRPVECFVWDECALAAMSCSRCSGRPEVRCPLVPLNSLYVSLLILKNWTSLADFDDWGTKINFK